MSRYERRAGMRFWGKVHGLSLAFLISVGLAVRLLTAFPMRHPGYMDAAYYADGAMSLYEGRGFFDPFIWNYLDDPDGIPRPSHVYWMPLSSILAYLSFIVLGPTYRAAQVPFALLSALVPVLSYLVAYDVAENRRHALYAGLFAVFGGFYTAYWVTPDNFAPYAVAGGLCLWAAGRGLESEKAGWYVLSGLSAGLAHLARADGFLLVLAVLIAAVSQGWRWLGQRRERIARLGRCCALLVFCYLLVMMPWLVRNQSAIGRPLSTAGLQTAWLTSYDDLYSYGKPLTLRSYLDWGWENILRSKLEALWINAQTLFVAGWLIFLAPFGLIGAWRLRRRIEFRPAWLYGVLLYLAMSLVFTYPGWRGGMLHSTAALLPFLYAAAVEGLDASIAWIAQYRRDWEPQRAQRMFAFAAVFFAVLLSGALYVRGLDKFREPHVYENVAAWMSSRVPAMARVMVNDPASFYYHSGRESLSIPNADLDTVLQVMARYDADYLVLDGHYASLRALYEAPYADVRLIVVGTFGEGDERVYLLSRRPT